MEVIWKMKSGNIDQTYRAQTELLKTHKQNQYENKVGSRTFQIKLRYGWIMCQTYREGIEGWLAYSMKNKAIRWDKLERGL